MTCGSRSTADELPQPVRRSPHNRSSAAPEVRHRVQSCHDRQQRDGAAYVTVCDCEMKRDERPRHEGGCRDLRRSRPTDGAPLRASVRGRLQARLESMTQAPGRQSSPPGVLLFRSPVSSPPPAFLRHRRERRPPVPRERRPLRAFSDSELHQSQPRKSPSSPVLSLIGLSPRPIRPWGRVSAPSTRYSEAS